MRSVKGIAIGVVGVLALGVFATSSVSAGSVYRGSESGQVSVSKDETIDGSAYLAGETVTVDGIVNGDIYCAGGTIIINATVDGDVLCAGSSLTVNGIVSGDVRLAGGTINLNGKVAGNATVFASDVATASDFELGGDMTGGASALTINGVVGRDLTVGAGSLVINGTIKRDVTSTISSVVFGDDASIGGNFDYRSDEELSIASGTVSGKTTFTMTEENAGANMYGASPLLGLLVILAIGFLALIGAVVMPRQVHAAGAISWGRFGLSVVAGLVFLVVTPIAAGLFLITGAGMFIAYTLVLVWLLLMAVAPVLFIYFVGAKLYGAQAPQVLVRTTIGAAVVMFLMLIPILNVILSIVMILSGVGMVLLRAPSLYEGKPYQVKLERKKSR